MCTRPSTRPDLWRFRPTRFEISDGSFKTISGICWMRRQRKLSLIFCTMRNLNDCWAYLLGFKFFTANKPSTRYRMRLILFLSLCSLVFVTNEENAVLRLIHVYIFIIAYVNKSRFQKLFSSFCKFLHRLVTFFGLPQFEEEFAFFLVDLKMKVKTKLR